MSDILQEIAELKSLRNAVIMAHNYTNSEIQDVADYTGDSLELARKAAGCNAPVIVFCGVRFMAETAKILSPEAVVLHPEPGAGCPMADMADPAEVAAYKKAHPETLLIAYVNTTAATKCEVDLCCTSGNAEKIIGKLSADTEIMFLPDRNLGNNVSKALTRSMKYWQGCCPIHDRITVFDIESARVAHPGAQVLVHPECRPEVVAVADAALSTGGMLTFVKDSAETQFIIATEIGILHRMRRENPGKQFFPLETAPVCEDMKKISLEKIRDALRDMAPQVELDADTIARAVKPIQKMLELS